jgi:hypothetical protein
VVLLVVAVAVARPPPVLAASPSLAVLAPRCLAAGRLVMTTLLPARVLRPVTEEEEEQEGEEG